MTDPGVAGSQALSGAELAAIVRRLGAAISHDHPGGVVFVGLLKGSVCFLADLARQVEVPCAVDFLSLLPYGAGGQRVRLSKDLDVDVAGSAVVLAVDIVDRGLTVSYVHRLLLERGAGSVRVCTLLDRPARRLIPVELSYVGHVIGDEYVVGYGLDLDERFRNLPDIRIVDPQTARHASPESLRQFFER
ncbi:MAG: phosphoribosyltransferase [Acidimicrobiales bacterium]